MKLSVVRHARLVGLATLACDALAQLVSVGCTEDAGDGGMELDGGSM